MGAFDGLHLGHRALVGAARRGGARAIVVTFDRHPAAVLAGTAPPRLLEPAARDRILRSWGVARVVQLRATRALFRLSPEAFLRRLAPLGAKTFIVGPDFRFGRGRRGDAETIRAAGYRVRVVAPVRRAGGVVSSTRIRAALARGDIRLAQTLVGRSLRWDLPVRKGAGRGRRIGTPTLNFPVPTDALGPGVYAGMVDDKAAVFHLGPRPTFDEPRPALEAHLLGRFTRTPRHARIELVDRLRAIRRFRDSTALVAQIRRDIDAARRILSR